MTTTATTEKSPARGSWQQEIWDNLTYAGEIPDPTGALRGRAKSYWSHYNRSLADLIERANEMGYRVEIDYQKVGGRTRKMLILRGREGND